MVLKQLLSGLNGLLTVCTDAQGLESEYSVSGIRYFRGVSCLPLSNDGMVEATSLVLTGDVTVDWFTVVFLCVT